MIVKFSRPNGVKVTFRNSTFIIGSGSGGGSISDGDKGDITVSSSGAVWTIDSNVVSNAKLAQVSVNTIKGRITTGTGDVEDLTASQVRTILNVENGAQVNTVNSVNSQTGTVVLDADDIDDTSTTNKFVTSSDITKLSNLSGTNTGDITVTDTSTINHTLTGQNLQSEVIDDSITFAKLQNISTNHFIGRHTSGSGDAQQVSAAQARNILNVEDGAEVNNISDVNATDLTDGGDSTLHFHATDRNRANHTGTQTLSTISDAGTAASEDVGTNAGNVVQLDGSARLPAVDGSQLTNLPTGFSDPMTTRGDIIYRDATNTTDRLGAGTAGQVLTSDGTDISWQTPASGGDITGPASSTDNAIARFDSTTGKIIQNSLVTVDDSGNIATSGTVDGRDVSADGSKLDGIESGAQVNTVDSVNTQTGAVVLDADDIDDTSTTHKFVTAGDLTKLSNLSGTNTGDVTVTDSGEIDFTLTGQNITASLITGSIDETKLDASVNASLDLADSSLQSSDIGSSIQAHSANLDSFATKTAPTGAVVGTSDTQTLSNKTLTAPVISTISNTGAITLPTSTDTLVGRATTDTLTNKTIDLTSNTLNGTIAQFNTALSDADFATLAGTETLSNKTLGNTTTLDIKDTLFTLQDDGDNTKKLQFELSGIATGTTRTLTVQNSNGTIALTSDVATKQDDLSGLSITQKATPVSGDKVLIQDSASSDDLKYVLYSAFGGGGGSATEVQQDQSGTPPTGVGALSGSVNGSNTLFTVSRGAYTSGKLEVFLNGNKSVQGTEWTQTTPGSGTFTFTTAPASGDVINVVYDKPGTDPGCEIMQTGALSSCSSADTATQQQYSHIVTAPGSFTGAKIGFYCDSYDATNSPVVEVGIYTEAGSKLQSQTVSLTATGFYSVTLPATVDLTANTRYYLSILNQTSGNTSTFLRDTGRSSAVINRIAGGTSSMPSTLAAGLGTGRSYWIIITTA